MTSDNEQQKFLDIFNEAELKELTEATDQAIQQHIGSTAIESSRTDIPISPEGWADSEYKKLAQAWVRYGIEIPKQEDLRERLSKARSVINELTESLPDLKGRMGILLVPPTEKIGWPIKTALRNSQGIQRPDSLKDLRAAKVTANNNWRVLVTDVTPDRNTCNYFGTPKAVLEEERYMIAGYDTRAMGIVEYATLTLQEDYAAKRKEKVNRMVGTDINGNFVDHFVMISAPDDPYATRTMLLREYSGDTDEREEVSVPYGTFIRDRFKFALDLPASRINLASFRPTVEV